MESPPPVAKAPQPRRSCLTCASAKVKCVQSQDEAEEIGGKCDRCRRLSKECIMQAATARKPRTRRKTTRVAQLEKKLDGLVHLLTSKENGRNGYPSPESVARRSSIASPMSVDPSRMVEDLEEATLSPQLMPQCMPGSLFRTLSHEAAQKYLDTFQSEMTTYFPFVIIPHEITAERLRRTKPALFNAVVVAASFADFPNHLALGEDHLRYLNEELLVKGEKSLDLLQSLLIYSTWYHYMVHVKKRLTHLVSMMAALVTDLGLSRINSINERLTATIEDTKGLYGCASESGIRTLEERRAYLGVFFISSTISTNYKDINALRRSAYQEDCCLALEKAAEYPTDSFLVALARLQQMEERVTHTFQYGSKELTMRHNWRIPLTLYTMPLDRDFEAFKESLPLELQQNGVLNLHYHSARAHLFEIAIYEPTQSTYFGERGFRRMEFLWTCLQAVKSFYETLDSIPTEIFYFIPLFNWTQLTHSLLILSKLCFLDAEDWNASYAREEAQFSETLHRVASKLEEARALHNVDKPTNEADSDVFSRIALRLRMVKAKYDKRIASESNASGNAAPMTMSIGPNQLDDSATMDLLCNLEGEAFWEQLMGGLELQNVEQHTG